MEGNHAPSNRRQFSRFLCDGRVVIQDSDRRTARLVDLSLRGALIERPEKFTPHHGDEADLEIQLRDSDSVIRMGAIVAHFENDRVGFECKSISLESISELRRLVELNQSDETLLHRELATLGQVHSS